jgi:hypothetical protein
MNRIVLSLISFGLSCALAGSASAQGPGIGGPKGGKGPHAKHHENSKGPAPKHLAQGRGPGPKAQGQDKGPGAKTSTDKDFAAAIRAAVKEGIIGQKLADYIQQLHEDRGPEQTKKTEQPKPKAPGRGPGKEPKFMKGEANQEGVQKNERKGPAPHKKPKKLDR